MDEDELKEIIEQICPALHLVKDDAHTDETYQAWRCLDCGQIVRFGTELRFPSWAHYKPGYEPLESTSNTVAIWNTQIKIPDAFRHAFEKDEGHE